MLAYGFQGSLLGVRAVKEEFSLTATGFMMSGYFVGYFIGAKTIPQIISRVGHIRVFAAFASVSIVSSFNSRCICKSFCMVFVKSAYWNKYGLYLYCS
jgi:MFS family permease